MTTSGLKDELRLAAGMPRLVYVKVPAPDREPGLSRMLDGIRAEGAASNKKLDDAAELGELGELVAGDLAMMLAERFAAPARAGPPAGASVTGHDAADGAGSEAWATGRCGIPPGHDETSVQQPSTCDSGG